MKKTTLFILASAAFVMIAMPVNAQKKVTLEQVQKSEQQGQKAQVVKPAAATTTTTTTGTAATPATTKTGAATVTSTPPAGATPVSGAAVNPAAANQVKPATAPAAPPVPLTCTWDVTDYDFGKSLVQLKPGSATFTVNNAGKEPVTITLVQPSCGCTSPKYTKEPIKPGEKGEVVLTYDAKVSGYFSKSAVVKMNDGQKYVLTIKGEVQKVEQPATTATEK